MVIALRAGFAQISDDDYARTVIAESFAHAPKLDPSGTSWLPLPFWVYGAAMMLFGRSLATARALAFVLGIASAPVPYLGLRAVGSGRWAAVLGAALAALTPWSVWLGLAPVPEGWAGLLVGAAFFFLAARTGRGALTAAGLVLVASLSRYEAWPAAAFIAIVGALRVRGALGRTRLEHLACAGLAVLGPVLWLANNAYAHGDALHFFARVAAFRRASTGGVPIEARLLEYPRALWQDAPEILLASLVGVVALARRGARGASFRSTWALPLAGAATVIAVLVYGDVRDGAPTHHPVRALVPVLCVLAGFGAAGLEALGRSVVGRVAREAWLVAVAVFFVILGVGSDVSRALLVPGNGDTERRGPQIARGRDLASKGVRRLVVTPCAYEHFALIAAFGAPERVEIRSAPRREVTADCPAVQPE
jgi:hypothetical protein